MFRKKIQDDPKNMISAGNPEAGGVAESAPKAPERGAEIVRQIESRGERHENQVFESQNKTQPSQQNQPQKAQNTKQVQWLKVFGYKVPPQIASNFRKIRNNKDKGDPQTGIACLYMFLDRLLKIQSK